MIVSLLVLIGVAVLIYVVFLLGFRLGDCSSTSALQRVRTQAAVAHRELHELTRAAFVAMAEEAERRRDRRK